MVSIIIVNYNTCQLLKDCLTSVYEHTKKITFEILVVDNASSDNSVAMVREKFPHVILISIQENLGFGKANNLAVEKASGDYLFFLNSDTRLLNNAVYLLEEFLKNNPDAGICGGNLTDLNGHPVHSFNPFLPGPWDDLFRFFPWLFRLKYGCSWEYNHRGQVMPVGYITGADLFISKEMFLDVKGFDPAYFMYYEEADLSYCVKKKGFTIYSLPQVTIMHVKGASLEFLKDSKPTVFQSKYYYLYKYFGRSGIMISHFIFSVYRIMKQFVNIILFKSKTASKHKEYRLMDKREYKHMVRKIKGVC